MTGEEIRHPATFSRNILKTLDEIVPAGTWLDPFAGTGKVHRLARPDRKFLGIELEREWANMHYDTICADSLVWMEQTLHTFDGIVTSPVYGNRMSDHHNASDASQRRGYKFDLGRDLSPNNSGGLYFWQAEYKEFHVRAWQGAWRVTRDGGEMFLNVKNFYRTVKKERVPMPVVGWHMKVLQSIGFKIVKVHQVGTPSMRYGENSDARYIGEAIIQATKGES